MLQGLVLPDRLAELLARFQIFESHRMHRFHRADASAATAAMPASTTRSMTAMPAGLAEQVIAADSTPLNEISAARVPSRIG